MTPQICPSAGSSPHLQVHLSLSPPYSPKCHTAAAPNSLLVLKHTRSSHTSSMSCSFLGLGRGKILLLLQTPARVFFWEASIDCCVINHFPLSATSAPFRPLLYFLKAKPPSVVRCTIISCITRSKKRCQLPGKCLGWRRRFSRVIKCKANVYLRFQELAVSLFTLDWKHLSPTTCRP